MDRTITARKANRRFPAILRDVQRGESFAVTSRGRPVARIVPFEHATLEADVEDLLVFLDGLPRRRANGRSRDDLYV